MAFFFLSVCYRSVSWQTMPMPLKLSSAKRHTLNRVLCENNRSQSSCFNQFLRLHSRSASKREVIYIYILRCVYGLIDYDKRNTPQVNLVYYKVFLSRHFRISLCLFVCYAALCSYWCLKIQSWIHYKYKALFCLCYGSG